MRMFVASVVAAVLLATGCRRNNGMQHAGPGTPYIVAALIIVPILGIAFLAYRHYSEPAPTPVEPL